MAGQAPEVTPNLWFDTEADDAAAFYVDVFDGELGPSSRYDAASATASGRPEGSTMTVSFEIAGRAFVALNGGPQFTFTPSISFVVTCPTRADVDDLWAALSADGEALMPLDSYPFSERYGWTADRYGVSWQLMYDDVPERSIVPSLLFAGDRCGRAAEAIRFYTSVFEESAVGDIARYGPDQAPEKEGTVMHGEFTLRGQRFAAMDSALDHDFDFSEAISFVVDCESQAEVDHFWDRLTSGGGDPGQCGWLTDRFGVSWQVVPTVLTDLLQDEDDEAAERVTEAMLGMGKIDVAALEAAHAG